MTSTCKNMELNEKPKSNDSNEVNRKKSITREERKSFLNSRENLSISDIEQGFNKNLSCIRINKCTVFNVFIIVLIIICIFFETFNLPRVIDNKREIENLRRELDVLRRQFYEENFLEKIMAFEEQLYEDDETDDSEQESEDYADYDLKIPMTTNSSTADEKFERALDELDKLEEIKSKDWKKMYDDNLINKTNKLKQIESNQREKRFISDESPVAYTKDNVPIFQSPFPRIIKNQTDYKHRKNLTDQIISRDYIIMKNYFKRKNQGNRRQYRKVPEAQKLEKRIKKRNLQMSRQIAAHYGADSSLFKTEDEHTGNGRARHSEGVFKAWRPSDWMNDFGMDDYFVLADDGRLTIKESGLYLIYAQIHYLDQHDENGFHFLVNGHPILQCMVYSPGTEHKSRSCFSAQVTFFENGDQVVLKDIGGSRYTLFQKDKSFFGIIKLGDIKKQLPLTTSETPLI